MMRKKMGSEKCVDGMTFKEGRLGEGRWATESEWAGKDG